MDDEEALRPTDGAPDPDPLAFAAAWRAQCPLRGDIVFLNPGTLGTTLTVASRHADRLRRRWMREGPGAALDVDGADGYQRMRRSTDAVRGELAAWLGLERRHVALTGNATDGLHQALASIDWRPGDRVVTTDEEHEALTRALDRLVERPGIAVDRVAFPAADGDASFAGRVAARLTPATRLVALSHVSHKSGVTADVAGVARSLAGGPALLLVDGAHGAGTRLPVVDPGVDFYAFPGHKWLFGPVGTGVLVVSDRALRETRPLLAGSPAMDARGREYRDLDGGWRYEAGTRDWAALSGLGRAVAFRRAFAERAILDQYDRLSAAFLAGLGGRWPATGRGPVLRLAMPSAEAWAVARAAWQRHRVIVKPTDDGLRITLGPWLTPAEADAAAALVASCAGVAG